MQVRRPGLGAEDGFVFAPPGDDTQVLEGHLRVERFALDADLALRQVHLKVRELTDAGWSGGGSRRGLRGKEA